MKNNSVIELIDIAEKEDIILGIKKLPVDLLGVYYKQPKKKPVILLDESLKKNPGYLKCVLAEEIGHHFTHKTNKVHYHKYKYESDLKLEEIIADIWSLNYFIGIQTFIILLKEAYSLKKISELYEIPVEFVKRYFKAIMFVVYFNNVRLN